MSVKFIALILLGGVATMLLYKYFYLRLKWKNSEGIQDNAIREIERNHIKETLEQYYSKVVDDYYRNYWFNDVRNQFSVSEIKGEYYSTVKAQLRLSSFGFSFNDSDAVEDIMNNMIVQITNASHKPSVTITEKLSFLYDYHRYTGELRALLEAQKQFDLLSKNQDYYIKLKNRLESNIDKLKIAIYEK